MSNINLNWNIVVTNDFVIELLKVFVPFVFALIIFILTQRKEDVRWKKDAFIKRRQDVYIDYYNEILNIKNNLSFIISEFFMYNAAGFADIIPDNIKNWDERIDFDQERNRLSEEINKILNVFKEYSFSYNKFMVYFDKAQISSIDADCLRHFISGLGTVEAHIMDLNSICISKKEDRSGYYYQFGDFNWRLNKIRCSGQSILDALNNSGLIEYLEKEIVI